MSFLMVQFSTHEARLVATWYAKKYGLDYEDAFNPVARMLGIRNVIALTSSKKWGLH